MPPHLSVIVIDSDAGSRKTLEKILRQFPDAVELVGIAAEFTEGMRLVQTRNPGVVFLEVSSLDQGAAQVEHILAHFPRTSVIALAADKSSEWILRLIRAGAVEYLLRPVEALDVTQALQKLGRLSMPVIQETRVDGKIIAVYNPVGGMGTTTVAVNIAACLAKGGEERVALVDLNFISGDIDCFLDVSPAYTLSSVTSNISRLDGSFLMGAMTKHSTGIYILTEPLDVNETLSITSESVTKLLSFLRGSFSWVVLDCSGHLSGCTLSAFEMSDRIFYNLTLSVPTLRNAKRYLAAMERSGLPREKINVVINRVNRRSGITEKDAERILEVVPKFSIPNEYDDVVASINKGMPLVALSARSPVSRAIMTMVDGLKGEVAPRKTEGGSAWSTK